MKMPPLSFLRLLWLLALVVLACEVRASDKPLYVLSSDDFASYVERFNAMEDEPVANLVPNAASWEWLKANVPFFACDDKEVEEIYWYRWWALRKHLKIDPASQRHVFTEFLTKPRPVSSALGHHLMEGRWLRDQSVYDDYVLYWLRGAEGGKPQGHLHKYSQWLQYALWQRWLVTQDTKSLGDLFDDLVGDYVRWETEKRTESGLFWQYDVWDAMEESISGGRKVKNLRPPLNSYMFGNAIALSTMAKMLGRDELAKEFQAKAAEIRKATEEKLWNPEAKFFEVRREDGTLANVREEIGFIPWYFKLPEPNRGFETAWAQLTDEQGFKAPFGITTAERRHPQFRSHGVGTCEWDGAVWPFATSQTLTALANVLREYPQQVVSKRDYFDAFKTYVKSHRYDGKPYIGEYLDEKNGQWLMGKNPRSRYYNHSTFADLLISGVVGLQPRADGLIEVDPLLPEGTWNWFCLDGVRYHGRDVTIVWDRDGKHFGRGVGLAIFVNGKEIARSTQLGPLKARLP
ncbi:MAG: trehalase family glycosidase [Nibricoccus sp.]